jgi:lipoprotein-releasing system ATP-binding protein|tara:strand:- start:867 stop:1637 length:771 start_codon:yes stop_codon:yes gene_type:complete
MSSAYKLPETKITLGAQQSQFDRAAAPVVMRAAGLMKSYRKGQVEIPVLNGVDFEVSEGEFQAIVGTSGSGKSTLLHLLATLDQPDGGEIFFQGNRIDNLPAKSRDILRNRYIGMVFQFYHLLPELSALENVLMPLMIRYGFTKYMLRRRKNRQRAKELLDKVGLSHRLKHRPRELSGGEMQRVAIARSLIADPQLLLADEPTGNLDRQAGDEIMEIFRDLNREQGLTVVMVTHDDAIAEQADRTIHLVEGRVQTR